MRRTLQRLARILAAAVLHSVRMLWWYLRQVSGEAAYENYRRRFEPVGERVHKDPLTGGRSCETVPEDSRFAGERMPSRSEFYLETLERRYSGISRCC
jgi:hypothetical protein